jgi:hypothetical protein
VNQAKQSIEPQTATAATQQKESEIKPQQQNGQRSVNKRSRQQ